MSVLLLHIDLRRSIESTYNVRTIMLLLCYVAGTKSRSEHLSMTEMERWPQGIVRYIGSSDK